jgi:HAD superfamily hydrolase (TIGR01509 family)
VFDLVIFDCDGTLVDSETLSNAALLAVLHEDGFSQYDMDYALTHWLGTTVADSLRAIAAETGREIRDDVTARYIARVRALQDTDLNPVAGAAHLIGTCKRDAQVCVASNGERNNVLQALTVTGLMPFFTEHSVFTKIQVERPKPYPDLFLFAAERMGVAPEKCLVVEDSTTGVRAGVAAGMTVWGFTGTAHMPADHAAALMDAGAKNIFARLTQMADLIAEKA